MSAIPLKVVSDNTITLGMEKARVIFIDERPAYTGEYTVTPSSETQVLQTNALRMTGNITVNPIPQNYGLVTWNGSTLTIS